MAPRAAPAANMMQDPMSAAQCGGHLSCKGLEESSWPDNGVRDVPSGLQFCLKSELGVLELQEGLLHADGAQQHKVRCALLPRHLQHILRRLVVNIP